MSELKGKIDFTLFVSADNANPNGDPLNGNRPRINMDGHGEISDVCIKRKIRNRLQDLGQKIFVQSDDRTDDLYTSLKDRADGCEELKTQIGNKKNANRDACAAIACKEYAFSVLGLNTVYSIIRDNNIASQNVAKRNGMTVCGRIVKHYYGMDMPHLVYRAERDAK